MPPEDRDPLHDPARLAALRETGLLDSPPEPAFDRATRLAARLLRAPVALVTLVDGDRQFFKSSVGLAGPWAAARGTPLSHSLCRHTLAADAPLVVEDARAHPLLRDSPAVAELQAVAYLGVPLRVGGHVLGTLCVMDRRPRAWTAEELESLGDLAAGVATEIALRAAEPAPLERQPRLQAVVDGTPDPGYPRDAGGRMLPANEAAAARALARERDFTDAVVNTADALIVVMDAAGRMVRFNRACERLSGYAAAEVVGRHFALFLSPQEAPDAVELFGELQAGSFPLRQETGWMTRRGEVRHLSWSYTALLDEAGAVEHVVGVGIDVTEQRRAEQALRRSEERFRGIVESAGDIIYEIDMEGRFTYVNRAAAVVLGYDAQDVVGLHYRELMLPEHHEAARALYRRQFEERLDSTYFEFAARAADGRPVWIGQVVRPIWSGERPIGMLAVARDISARREVERLKDQFVGLVSHELRTPLTSIRGSLGLLASGKLGRLSERGQRMVEIATQNTDRLVRLINDILDVERLESGEVPLERRRVRAAEVVGAALEAVLGTAAAAGVPLAAEPAPELTLEADPDRVVQVLVNLLSNAVKFSPPGAEVRVSVAREGGSAIFRVHDRGRGIPAEMRDAVFDRFQQVSVSDARERGGSGLGLSIARAIVEQHGGRIWVEGGPGRGSTFLFTLPVAEAPLPGGAAPPAPRPGAGRGQVLVVEHDVDLAHTLAEAFTEAGFRVRQAHTGEEGVRQARALAPALLVLEAALPGGDGFQVVAGLREDPVLRSLPTVVYAAKDLTPAERARLELGPTRFLTKTRADPSHVLRAAAELLRAG